MGVVYKARQVSLNRIVAVKMLLFGRLAGDVFGKRFRAEAEAAASLQHRNIVAIYEVGEHEGQPYFTMDFVEGQSLAERARDRPLPPRVAVGYVQKIAEAIHYAHQRGILHRDLKPSNLLIDTLDQPRITDFGLAKQLHKDSDLTLTGQVLGTPQFMPPEQAQGRRGEVTIASDVHSLGAILYYLLTGRPPFLSDTLETALVQLLHHEPPPPPFLNRAVPRDLETVCLKCLSKEPPRRYASAQALADDLNRWLQHEPIQARPTGPAEALWRWCRRKPALAASIAIICLMGALGLAGILWQWHRAERNAVRETAQRLRAEEAVTMLELQRAEDLLEKDEILMCVAYLARIVCQQPSNLVASRRLLSALTMRNFALPVGPPLQHGKKVNYAEFSPDGRRVVTASLDFTARLWDARTGEPVTSPLLHQQAVRFAQFSPDGGRVATLTDDFRAHLWDATTGGALGQSMAHTKKIWTAQFSPDGTRVLTASEDGMARVWNALTGEPMLEPLLHQAAVRSARFSPKGRHIVTASADKTVQLWDALTGRPARPPLQHGSGVIGAEFSPDGRWVVTVAEDSSTCVWDVASGEPLAKPLVHPEHILNAKFSPDVERIATVPGRGEARIWRARDWATRLRTCGPSEVISESPTAKQTWNSRSRWSRVARTNGALGGAGTGASFWSASRRSLRSRRFRLGR